MKSDNDCLQFDRDGVKVNTTRTQMAALINNLVFDDQFRTRFSTSYVDMLKKEGIVMDEETIQKLNTQNLSAIVSGLMPQTKNPAAVAVIAAVIVLSTPTPAE